MTDQMISVLQLDCLVASTTNPRKHFDPVKLQELADSIKASGVHQPILVRPLPGARVPDTAPGVTHEVVCGERRFRASTLAGASTIPVWVRTLTDEQALEAQVIENLQRDDLTALDEAEGYEQLIRLTGIDRAGIAAKIGKSQSYVNARIKLLDLGVEGRQALAEGKLDASRALLIARIPSTELQAKAAKQILSTNYYGSSMSYREAADYVQREFMLRLPDAKFSKIDADLVPDAGACKACPKRTGANPDLFSDVKGADVCTDVACYRKKEAAHQAKERAEAEARGITIIEGREARELMPSSWSSRVEGHLRLDDKADSPTDKPLRAVLKTALASGEIKPIYVANPHRDGELVAVLPTDQVAQLLREKGNETAADELAKDEQNRLKNEQAQLAQTAKTKLEATWRWQVLEAVWAEVQGAYQDLTDAANIVIRAAAEDYVQRLRVDQAKALAKLLDLGKVAPKDGLKQWVKDTAAPLAGLTLMVAHGGVEYRPWITENYGRDGSEDLWRVADSLGVDRAGIEREARSQARREAAEQKKAEKASSADAPAALADGVRGKGKAKPKTDRPAARPGASRKPAAPKISEQEARQGIADAMQGDEAPAILRSPASGAMDTAVADQDPGHQEGEPFKAGAKKDVPALPGPVQESDRITVDRPKHHDHGRTGMIMNVRSSGKARVMFDDGSGEALLPVDWLKKADVGVLPAESAEARLRIGLRVRVNGTATSAREARFIGRKGEIVAQIGPECWDVNLTMGRKGSGIYERKSFMASELEVVA